MATVMIGRHEIIRAQKTLGEPYDEETIDRLEREYREYQVELFEICYYQLTKLWWDKHPEVKRGLLTEDCIMECWPQARMRGEEQAREELINAPVREYLEAQGLDEYEDEDDTDDGWWRIYDDPEDEDLDDGDNDSGHDGREGRGAELTLF